MSDIFSKQNGIPARALRTMIVRRQLAVRREVYEDLLRKNMGEDTEEARTIVTYIGNYFSFCDYAMRCGKKIPFYKELDYLENYLLMERLSYGDCFRLEKNCETSDFALPSFTVFPLIRETALNMAECGRKAEIWIKTAEEREGIKITVRHDIPEECLYSEEFRKNNSYGFALLQERLIRSCGGSLERKALDVGLMENTFTLPRLQTKNPEPVYIWF